MEFSTRTLRIGVMTDIHIALEGTGPTYWHNPYDFAGSKARAELALKQFEREQVDIAVVLGDLSHRGEAAPLARAVALCAQSPRPTWLVPGNHDLPRPNGLSTAIDDESAPNLKRGSSSGDTIASGLRLVALPIASDDAGTTCAVAGDLPVADWNDDAALVLSHFPLISRAEKLARLGLPYAGDLVGREDVLDTLRSREAPSIVLSGHLHIRDSCADGPVLQLLFAAMIEHPFECSIVEIEPAAAGPIVHRKAISLKSERVPRTPVLVPERETWQFASDEWSRATTER